MDDASEAAFVLQQEASMEKMLETLWNNGIGFQPIRPVSGAELCIVLGSISESQSSRLQLQDVAAQSGVSEIRIHDWIGNEYLIMPARFYAKRFHVLKTLNEFGWSGCLWIKHLPLPVSKFRGDFTQYGLEAAFYRNLADYGHPFRRSYVVELASHYFCPYVYRHWDDLVRNGIVDVTIDFKAFYDAKYDFTLWPQFQNIDYDTLRPKNAAALPLLEPIAAPSFAADVVVVPEQQPPPALPKQFEFPKPNPLQPKDDVEAGDEVDPSLRCTICMANKRKLVYRPCNHYFACISCTYKHIDTYLRDNPEKRTVPCPYCKSESTEVITIFTC